MKSVVIIWAFNILKFLQVSHSEAICFSTILVFNLCNLFADPSRGIRNPKRWYETTNPDHFDRPLPPEWFGKSFIFLSSPRKFLTSFHSIAWIHLRRVDPPTEEEIKQNLQLMKQKKENAAQKTLNEHPDIGIHVEGGGQFMPGKKTVKGHKLHDEYVKKGHIVEGESPRGFPMYRDLEQSPGTLSKHATEEDREWFDKKRKISEEDSK
jgi:hypothetical protein